MPLLRHLCEALVFPDKSLLKTNNPEAETILLKFQQVAVAQSVLFACGLRATEFLFCQQTEVLQE
jgi:hypothetical protein